MSYLVPEEITKLYAELETAFSRAMSENRRKTANAIRKQMNNLANSQMSKAVDNLDKEGK